MAVDVPSQIARSCILLTALTPINPQHLFITQLHLLLLDIARLPAAPEHPPSVPTSGMGQTPGLLVAGSAWLADTVAPVALSTQMT